MSANLVSKLALKSMGAQPKRSELVEGAPALELAVIFGRVTGYKIGQSNYGDFTQFTGSFEGTNVRSGDVYKSSKCFVPAVLEGMLRDAVDAADGAALDFAIKISAKHSNNQVGYEYVVQPLVEAKESDELAALRETVSASVKALPAPEKKPAAKK